MHCPNVYDEANPYHSNWIEDLSSVCPKKHSHVGSLSMSYQKNIRGRGPANPSFGMTPTIQHTESSVKAADYKQI